jgi:beta-phosphoglucomutase-like phosphatase (HAD superfamily)
MSQNTTPPRTIQAVLWDLDGVLVDTETILFTAERIAFAAYGAEITPEFKRQFIGMGGSEVLVAMAEALGIEADVAELGRRKLDAFAQQLPFLEGFAPTAEMVRAFSDAGLPQAVASGSSREGIRAALRLAGLDELLTVHVSVDDVAAGKPAPDVFLEAARRLAIDPSACLVVEDAVPGVLAAKSAGMMCLAIPSVPEPLDARFEQADLVVRDGMAGVDARALVNWAHVDGQH